MKTDYSKFFVPGALKCPDSLPKSNKFGATASFLGPRELLLDGYCTAIENQGDKPWCAAYAATSYAESILWRKNGYHKDIDPAPIYKYCKTIDGDPEGDGTSLTCAMRALLAKGVFSDKVCRVRTIGGLPYGNDSFMNDLKYSIHKYGCVEIGCNITSNWYTPKDGVIKPGGTVEGGHAIVMCGYDENGVVICNSWGAEWGHDGKAYLSNSVFRQQFMYASLLTHVFFDLD